MSNHTYIGFLETLEQDDYGVIVDSNGKLKGVWVPYGHEDNLIPEPIVQLCLTNFGIDPNDDEDTSLTVH